MSEAGFLLLDEHPDLGRNRRMRATAHVTKSPRRPDVCLVPAAPRSATALRLVVPQDDGGFAEPPAETDAWWLSRSQAATFTRRRIPLVEACVRSLLEAGGRVVVEFNGASFAGASVVMTGGRHELELGDALAQEMSEVLDEDDGLAVELVAGRSQPTLAIHPYVALCAR